MLLAAPAHAIAFARVDRNHDGMITYDEARISMKRISVVYFDKCDSNGDGFIEASEFGCLAGIYDALYRNRNE